MTPLKAVELFMELWSFWPNQDDRGGSMTGFKYIATSEKLDASKLRDAAICYTSEVDVEYCHRLGNWMRDGHYLGWYSLDAKELRAEATRLSSVLPECKKLIEYWNKCHDSCDKFLPCLAMDDRIHLIRKAMKNQFFRENWEQALRKLYMLMSSTWTDDDPRNYIKPTIQWFCITSPDKFHIAKILEGEYGDPPKIRKKKSKEPEQQQDFTDPEQALQFFNSL